jgi:hypothetical protein
MNLVFANGNEEDSMYPLTTREIAKAQEHDTNLKTLIQKVIPPSWSKTSQYSVKATKW